jgi:hypothetical protein
MFRSTIALTAFLFLVLITIVFWFIPWPNADILSKIANYMTFVLTILGFSMTIYQLRETEIAIRESQEKPRLQLEILESKDAPGSYGSEKTHDITLKKIIDQKGKVGATLGLRITNSGTKAASKLWFTFLFKRKEKDELEAVGKLDIYIPEKLSFPSQIEYFDYYVRPDFDLTKRRYAGITFKFSDHLVIHTDHYDRPVVAEINLILNEKDIEPDFEIHYRIQSYEGNEILVEMKKKKIEKDQIYPIKFFLEK